MADNSQDQEEMVTQFSDVTGIAADRAKFYLEAANWTLQVRFLVPFNTQPFLRLCSVIKCDVIVIKSSEKG